ncbi:MAG: hypothetical protein ACLUI3_10905 [Christensenellales bacterium]
MRFSKSVGDGLAVSATFLNGLLNALESAVVELAIAMIIGCAGSDGGEAGGSACHRAIYVEFFQNTPLILQVCFLHALAYSGVKISVVVVGFVALILPWIYVTVLSARDTGRGQFDAAWSQGSGTSIR